jgi:hypothetical protein
VILPGRFPAQHPPRAEAAVTLKLASLTGLAAASLTGLDSEIEAHLYQDRPSRSKGTDRGFHNHIEQHRAHLS